MFIIDGTTIHRALSGEAPLRQVFLLVDDDVYNGLVDIRHGPCACGYVVVVDAEQACEPDTVAEAGDSVCIFVVNADDAEAVSAEQESVLSGHKLLGFVRTEDGWECHDVQVSPLESELYSRHRGLLESETVSDRHVLIAGLGSIGSRVAELLYQSGVGNSTLIDPERLEVCNVVRHRGGLSDVGRLKVRFMAEVLKNKNPSARVRWLSWSLDAAHREQFRELVREADVVINTADSREARLLCNRVCVEEGKVCIYGGAFHRAHGGMVLRARPHAGPCYQCYAMVLPPEAEQAERFEEAAGLQYTDRPMPIEPGLALDIDPISHMIAKLALQQLIAGRESTLHSLDADLAADLYLWLNRREPNTQYADVPPLGFSLDGLRILRWYGVEFSRQVRCPACGSELPAWSNGLDESADAEEMPNFGSLLES